MTTAETLARNLDAYGRKNSAAELRRLQASNEQLVEVLKHIVDRSEPMVVGLVFGAGWLEQAKLAIAQATGGAK